MMRRVVIESPFAANDGRTEEDHLLYLDQCILHCLSQHESPYASHAICTRVWDDNDPIFRKAGIEAGYAWHHVADVVVFYTDFGWSAGMADALVYCKDNGIRYEERKLS